MIMSQAHARLLLAVAAFAGVTVLLSGCVDARHDKAVLFTAAGQKKVIAFEFVTKETGGNYEIAGPQEINGVGAGEFRFVPGKRSTELCPNPIAVVNNVAKVCSPEIEVIGNGPAEAELKTVWNKVGGEIRTTVTELKR